MVAAMPSLTDDLPILLADFGVQCSYDGVQFKALLDEPDVIVQLQHADGHSRQYQLTYITSAVAPRRNQPITVGGQAYTVRQAPEQLSDGAFSRVMLSKA